MILGKLNPAGAGYAAWLGVLQTEEVPLVYSRPYYGRVTPPGRAQFYTIDVSALAPDQYARLAAYFARQCGVTLSQAREEIALFGVAIPAANLHQVEPLKG